MNAIARAVKSYFGEFGTLLKLPKEFWAIQGLNLVYCLAYFSFVTINSLHLSQDVGFSDQSAGLLIATFMTGTAILQIVMGPVLDRIGFRKTPLIAAAIVTIGFMGIGAAPLLFGATPVGRGVVVFSYLVAMVGNGLMFPILTAGTKRFSNSETRNPAFNCWYLTMNVGAMLVFVIDYMRRPLANEATLEQLATFRDAGGNAQLLWFMAGLTVVCWFVVFFLLKSEKQFPEFEAKATPTTTSVKEQKSLWQSLREIFGNKAFHKALGVLALTIPAHIPFVLVFVMYPKYWTRVVGPDVPIGKLEMINPIIIIVGLILLAPLVKKFNVYWVLLVGMVITSFSMLILAIPPRWVINMGAASSLPDAYLVLIYVQIVVFAVGEAIWSPQLQSYVASFTPEGSEGTFMGITRFPHTTAKLLAGGVSGFLLAHFCPEGVLTGIEAGTVGYTQGPETMNVLMALFCLISPVGLLLFKSRLFVEKKAE